MLRLHGEADCAGDSESDCAPRAADFGAKTLPAREKTSFGQILRKAYTPYFIGMLAPEGAETRRESQRNAAFA
ncbi:hypothetical protein, partial [Litorivita sp. NS0012-18]|uniref:hypothetical protein n=1 Tax=Litorivita sp. NS0012-18 TaxID=3127655 RepID=UPI00333E3EE8